MKAVRLERRGDRVKLLGLALAELDAVSDDNASEDSATAADRTAGAICAALRDCGAQRAMTARVVTAVGGPGVSIKHVTLPEMPKHALAEAIHWEARKHVPFDESGFVLDFQAMSGEAGNGEMRVLLAAAENRLIDNHIALLGQAGVEPDVVDLIPFALMNEADEGGLLDGEVLAMIELGVSLITVAVYRRGGLFFGRSVPMAVGYSRRGRAGAEAGTDRGDSASAPGDAPAATAQGAWLGFALQEVRRSLVFYNSETGRQGIDRVYLTGGRALVPGVAEAFHGALGIVTGVFDPFAAIPDSAVDVGDLRSSGPRFALAMGLARRV